MGTVPVQPGLAQPTPRLEETRRAVGPIVRALAGAVPPPHGEQHGGRCMERHEGGHVEPGVPQGRRGVHAAAYLARENFGCPGLDGCAFDTDEGGVFSVTLEDALGEMTDRDGAGGMEWDVDGRFARFLARRGGNHGWMVAAAAIYAAYTRMRSGGTPFSRSDLLERVHSTCRGFAMEHLSRVYEEMFPLLRNDEDR